MVRVALFDLFSECVNSITFLSSSLLNVFESKLCSISIKTWPCQNKHGNKYGAPVRIVSVSSSTFIVVTYSDILLMNECNDQ